MNGEASLGRGGDHVGVQDDPLVGVAQHGVGVVGGAAAGTKGRQIAGHPQRPSEQDQSLIDQMRSQIIPDARARTVALAPSVAHLGPPTIETALEAHHRPQPILGDQGLQGQEVSVPATIVEDRQ